MQHNHFIGFLLYLVLALFMVFPSPMVYTQTMYGPVKDKDVVEKTIPPIDQNTPRILDTASFGLG